ncbi:MAG TPA: hypothetical protein VL134_03845 [Leptolyngbya sp.]|jgi:hypothetical protein|nr:hypothetical protein [Leptolyngbya sp.]
MLPEQFLSRQSNRREINFLQREGNNSSTLTAKSTLVTQSLAAGEEIQAVADIDLNGSLDLLAREVNSTTDTTRVYTLDPTTFQIITPTTPCYLTVGTGEQATPIVPGDPNWDILDAAIVNPVSA